MGCLAELKSSINSKKSPILDNLSCKSQKHPSLPISTDSSSNIIFTCQASVATFVAANRMTNICIWEMFLAAFFVNMKYLHCNFTDVKAATVVNFSPAWLILRNHFKC